MKKQKVVQKRTKAGKLDGRTRAGRRAKWRRELTSQRKAGWTPENILASVLPANLRRTIEAAEQAFELSDGFPTAYNNVEGALPTTGYMMPAAARPAGETASKAQPRRDHLWKVLVGVVLAAFLSSACGRVAGLGEPTAPTGASTLPTTPTRVGGDPVCGALPFSDMPPAFPAGVYPGRWWWSNPRGPLCANVPSWRVRLKGGNGGPGGAVLRTFLRSSDVPSSPYPAGAGNYAQLLAPPGTYVVEQFYPDGRPGYGAVEVVVDAEGGRR